MKKAALCLITLLLVANVGLFQISGTEINDIFNNTSLFRDQNVSMLPTWIKGDTWIYEADIYSNTENGVFDISSDDLTLTVKDTLTIIHQGITESLYSLDIMGNISGTIESDFLTGEITGEIIGNASLRQADLSLLNSNISLTGVIEYLLFLESDFYMINNAQYYPRFEYFDFPLKTNEEWNITTNAYQQSSFYVEDFVPENTSEGNASMNGDAHALMLKPLLSLQDHSHVII